MTTDNIDGIDSADSIIAELGRLAKAAEKRAEALVSERRGIEVRRRHAERGLRVVERKFLDEESILDEEAIQLDWILRGDEADGNDEGGNPTPPAPADENPLDDTPHTPRDEGGDTPTTPTPVAHVMDVRRWSGLQWLLAAVGLIVALIIARFTWEWVVDDVNGFARGAIATGWWIGLITAGFFGGGFIGSRIEEDQD